METAMLILTGMVIAQLLNQAGDWIAGRIVERELRERWEG